MAKYSTAVEDYFQNVIKISWTWERLTEEEKQRFIGMNVFDNIKGNDKTRQEWLHTIYFSFLTALGYKPIGWREPKETNKHEDILIKKIEEAKEYCKGELELDFFENDMFGNGWYAMDYRELSGGAFPIDSYEKPLIKEETVKKYNVDVKKCCDICDVSYVG